MAKFGDLRAVARKVRVFDTVVDVTILQTSKTVFEASGVYEGRSISAKAGSANAAIGQWKHIAERAAD